MLIAFNKPYGVLSQFTKESPEHRTLAEFGFPKQVYPIGRLDWDSEGLLLLSDEKEWNDLLLNPKHAHERTYHVQVEGIANKEAMTQLEKGIIIQGRKTRPCRAKLIGEPNYPPRNPSIRFRLSIPTSWIELRLTEGKNRQVRRMTAAAGFPALRLIRTTIGKLDLGDLAAGKWRELDSREKQLLNKTC
jgi:23S rRNA pseudouridine2457 synthase